VTNYWWDIEQGKSGNSGVSLADAIRTFADFIALLPSLNPGDKVWVVPRNTPYQGYANMNRSGSSGNQIVIECAPYGGDADLPTFCNPVQANSGGTNIMIFDVNASYVTFRRLRFTDTIYAGLIQYDDKTGLQVLDCEFTHVGMGIRLKSGGFLITGCTFVDLDQMVADNNNSSDYGAVAISFEPSAAKFITSGTVDDCDFINCMADSRMFGKDGGAFEFFGNISGLTISSCRVRRSKGVFELGGRGVVDPSLISNIKIVNLVCEDTTGISFFFNNPSGSFGADISGIDIQHCSFDGRDRDVSLFFMDGLWGSLAGKLSIRNCIFVGGAAQVFKMNATNDANIGTMLHQDNIIWRSDGNNSSSDIGFTLHASEMSADPLFVDRENGNYRLATGSPAIGAAQVIAGYTTDHTGRAVNTPPDIGPLAYVTPTAPSGTIKQASQRSRMTDRSAYGTDHTNNLVGGIHHYNTEAERNDMVPALKVEGMIATVKDRITRLVNDRWVDLFSGLPPYYEPAVCEISYTVASNTAGGNGTVDVYSTRPLNTIDRNFSTSKPANPNFADAALVSNQFTLPPGIYFMSAWVVCNKTNATRLRLYNITDTAVALRGPSGWSPVNGDTNSILTIPRSYLSIRKSTTFELQQITDNLDGTTPTYQFGRPIGGTSGWTAETEIFAKINIERIR
jgi:hypothetical protein